MKKLKIISTITFLILAFILTKGQNLPATVNQSQAKDLYKYQLSKEQILKFLKNSTSKGMPLKNEFLDKIINAADFSKIFEERRLGNSTQTIVPLKEVYFSQHINKNKPHPLQYLQINKTDNNEADRALLLLVYPVNKQLKDLPKENFTSFNRQNAPIENGEYIFIELAVGDVKTVVVEVDNGIRWKATNFTPVTKEGMSKERSWQTGIYIINKDGTTTDKIVDLGTTTTYCPPGYVCDALPKK